MAKRAPDLKVGVGVSVGAIVAVISSVFMVVFHHSLDPAVVAALPAVLTLAGHFLGSYFAPYVPRVEEIITYVRKILAETDSV